jgi:tRNA (cmo5U34)-methyltransferase
MTKFDNSLWADTKFSQNYRDDADIFLPFRRQFIDIAKSFYGYFIDSSQEACILDLGCGDGLFIYEFLKSFSPKNITLVDGSAEMLDAAKARLSDTQHIDFIKIDFHKLIEEQPISKQFDFIYSSLAIHHLPFYEKCNLYNYIYNILKPGGYFIHYDVVISQSDKIEKWAIELWRQWIKNHPQKQRAEKLLDIPDKYKENQDNTPDTLSSQLQALEEVGFRDIDCHFKYGIFSLFGGFK